MRLLCVFLMLVAAFGVACSGGDSKEDKANDALNRGLQAHVEGNLDAAEADYREVLVTDPQNKYALYNLGLIDQTRGDLSSAENRYRLALNVDPNYAPALFNLAIVRAQAGDALEAIDLYRKTILVDDANAGAHYNLGLVLRSINRTAEGDAEIARAIELNPSFAGNALPTAAPVAATPTASATP